MDKLFEIDWANVSLVSLCKRGASKLRGLFKSDDGRVHFESLAKMDEEGLLLSLVYVPNKTDAQGHFARQEAIKKMAYSFARNGMQLDINHDQKPLSKERAFVAESFIVQPGDPRFSEWKDDDGQTIDATGGWALSIQLLDESLKKLYREEGWNGTSLWADPDQYRLIETDARAAAAASELLTLKKNRTDMDETKLSNMLTEALAKALAPVTESLKATNARIDELQKAGDKPDDQKPQAQKPQLPSDLTDKEAMAKYRRELAISELRANHDLGTSAGLAKFEAALAKMDGGTQDTQDTQEPQDPSLALALALGNIGIPTRRSGGQDAVEIIGGEALSKSDSDGIDATLAELGFGLDPKSNYARTRSMQAK